MDGDEPQGRVIPFPGGLNKVGDGNAEAFEAWLKSRPAYRRAREALAADAGASQDLPGGPPHADGVVDVWQVLDATVMSVAPEYFEAYKDEITFTRRFGFDLGRHERAGVVLFKHETGLTDRDIRLLGRTDSLRFGPAVTISAGMGQAAYGYALIALAGLLMLMGLLAATTPVGQTLGGATIVVAYEAVLVAFCWAFMRMYLRPYTLRRRVENLFDARQPYPSATSAQTASCSRAGA